MGRAETLVRIKDAEKKAQQILKEADVRYDAILVGARREAIERTDAAKEALKTKHDTVIAQERTSLDFQRNHLLQKGNEEASRLNAKAKNRISKAVLHVKQEFERTLNAVP